MGLFSRFTRPAWEKAAERARKAAAAGEHGVAARAFDEAIAAAPEEHRAALIDQRAVSASRVHRINFDEGEARERAGHVDRALEHFELALRFCSTDEERAACEEALSRLTVERRRAADAAARPLATGDVELDDDQSYAILIGAFPDEVADEYEERDAAFRHAFMAMHRGELEAALAAFEALASDGDAPAWTEVGRCRRGLGDLRGALDAFARAEQAAPGWNHVRLLATEAAVSADDLDTAEEVLQRAVDHDDEDPDVYMAICQVAIRRKETGYGLEAAEAGLEIEPTNRGLHLLRARLLEIAGRVDEALAGYEKRIRESWRYDAQEGQLYLDYDAAYLAAHLYRRLGRDPKRAAELFRGLMAVSEPGERWPHELALADVLTVDGKRGEAAQLLDELERVVPADDALAWCRIAELRGDAATLQARLAALDDAARAVWDETQAQRVRK